MFNFYKKHNIKPKYFKYSFLDLKTIKIKKTTTLESLGKQFTYGILKFANPQFTTTVVPNGSIVYAK
jgi:membrane-bound lytic murein transglycosylase D